MAGISLNQIAVAVDGSPFADRALSFAIDLAKRFECSLTILTVAPLTAYVATAEPWVPTEVLETEIRHYRGVLDAAVARTREDGLERVTGVCLEGHIADEIVGYLEKHPVDLLVLGSRGLSATKRLLLGSTSDEVSHHVSCPVLIVRQPAKPAA